MSRHIKHLLILATAAAVCGTGLVIVDAGASTAAIGDRHAAGRPVLPATCQTLAADLAAPTNELFGRSQEAAPPDTTRIQDALNSCAGSGKSVVLAAGSGTVAFLSAPLTVKDGEYLVINGGVTLYASRVASQYQASGGSTCGTVATSDGGCKPFIAIDGSNSGIEGTRGVIDGRGGTDIYGTSTTWWDNAQTAKSEGKNQVNPRLVQATGVSNVTVYDVDLVNPAKQHLYFQQDDRVTVWGLRTKTPADARNTDGIDLDSSNNATVTQSYIQAGDDCVAVSTNKAASSNTSILDNYCYGTHGLAVGSETSYGVTSLLAQGNYLQGTDSSGLASTSANGLRIKSDSSKGGLVSGVRFNSTCMTGEKYPLVIDPRYTGSTGTDYPDFKDITVNGVTAVNSQAGAASTLEGYSAGHPLGLRLENVSLDATSVTAEYAGIKLYNSNITPSGTGVTVTGFAGSGAAPSCAFPPFPGL
ncbi:glycoside hydrolase family 28 protein [Kitasatospora viridis]|uniref:Polygalacturonase n=1 Tax=Kitasatospora viridis TaxID=281105 RepID=A0A561TWE8_9ACTN|nr:glycosyl hydrolase family 28 protein [Kitasatospora viridis]TWF91433.1 polygalacturonase [Kitasatospora viridis]